MHIVSSNRSSCSDDALGLTRQTHTFWHCENLCQYTSFFDWQPLMPIDVHTDWCWLMMIDADWWWLLLIDADCCWVMLIDANWWWFIIMYTDWYRWFWLMLIDAQLRAAGWCWLMLIDVYWCWLLVIDVNKSLW